MNVIPPTFREDVIQAELVKRLEITQAAGRDTLITTLENSMILFLEKQFGHELSQTELNDVYSKATELVYELEEGAPYVTMMHVVQGMREYLRKMSRYDTSVRDFLDAVQDALPKVQDVADTYVEVIFGPLEMASAAVLAGAEAVGNKTAEVVKSFFSEERTLAYIGGGIGAVGLIYSLRK